ncbi:hypothetical protein FVB32_05300 [Flagellimonas hymeniacidonis]|uniref:Uncharacterized protein n=1 Tax=Flagellimonas hymeniacidonis TaxID=2603628 RepID=A0A5C8V726_9FLAO|nr:hypothetical protein [Flagellimonas hymeniacidonis]TXN37705.1 hypothetical protein FVB32_05300 [Flagellimonas hymeniacidonis]
MKYLNAKSLYPRLTLGVFLLSSSQIFAMNVAMNLGIKALVDDLWTEVKDAAPIILAIIFIIGILLNIGKLLGDNRDYKGFLTSVFLFFGGISIIGGVVSYILSISF